MILEIAINLIEKSEPQLAVWWFIPAIAAAIFAGSVIIIIITSTPSKPIHVEEGKSICILGPEKSGKTQLLSFLRGVPYTTYHQSQQDQYDEFETYIGGKKIKIKKGYDIGGEEFRIEDYYSKIIPKSDYIFFTFDAYKYTNDKLYQIKEVNSRLYYINRHKGTKPTVIFGSHMDEIPEKERESIIRKIQDEIADKEYKSMLQLNFCVTDLRESSKLKEYINKVVL